MHRPRRTLPDVARGTADQAQISGSTGTHLKLQGPRPEVIHRHRMEHNRTIAIRILAKPLVPCHQANVEKLSMRRQISAMFPADPQPFLEFYDKDFVRIALYITHEGVESGKIFSMKAMHRFDRQSSERHRRTRPESKRCKRAALHAPRSACTQIPRPCWPSRGLRRTCFANI